MSRSPRARYLLLLVLALLAGAPVGAAEQLLVTVGDVEATAAVLWARGPAEGELIVEWGPPDRPATGSGRLRVGRSGDLTGKLRLSGLAPATRYAYRVQQGGATATGEFVTAPSPDEATRVRFLWSGDLGGGHFCRRVDGGYRIFRAMAAQRADFFVFVGDTIYADHPCSGPDIVPGADFVAATLPAFRARHRYNREDPAVRAFFAGTSVYAIWDDHEVRNDFSGPSEPLMPIGRQAFLDYWPILPPAEEEGRLYRKFRWGRLAELFILDTRQYRSPNSDLDGPGKTMLGPTQRRWLIEEATASTAVWKLIVSSVSLSVPTGRTFRDSWSNASVWGIPEENGTGFATERDAILRALRDRRVKNVVFLVADVHHVEVIRHQPLPDFSVYEFIAGPLSASQGRPRALDTGLNPRSLFGRGGVNNFGEVTIEPPHLTVGVFDEDGAVLFRHVIGPE